MKTECMWHAGNEPIDVDEGPGCPNCQRLLQTKICAGCGGEFLDWDVAGFDDVMAGPAASSSGDLCCTGCIASVELDLERAEDEADEGDYREPEDVP